MQSSGLLRKPYQSVLTQELSHRDKANNNPGHKAGMWQAISLRDSCAGKRVLEIGSGGSPAVAFAALRHCRQVVTTDGSPEALRLLERNICANARSGLGQSTDRCCKAVY